LQSVLDRTTNRRRKRQTPANTPPTTPRSNTPPTQGFLAPSLATKASSEAKAHTDPGDDEILDLVHDIATDPKK